jgi:hypothetical protein
MNLGFAYPDSEVERSQRGGTGDPQPVGFVGLDGEDHRGAMLVAAGGALLGARRVRRRERAVELPPTVDQQRLQHNKKTRCMSLTQKFRQNLPSWFQEETIFQCKMYPELHKVTRDSDHNVYCPLLSEHFQLYCACVSKSTDQCSNSVDGSTDPANHGPQIPKDW